MNNSRSRLQQFRTDTYNLLGLAKDATMDLIDAVLTTRTAYSLADFSRSPLFRRKWSQLHFRNSSSVSMNLLRVEGLSSKKKGSLQKPLWLVFIGQQMPPIERGWKKYLRRFAVDHWYGFIKQRLHWTLPAFSTPHQCERWSDLMPLMTWQLWLAKDIVKDDHLPWQKPQTNLTPGRVAQSMLGLLVEIGTPARSPKPRGKSTGWKPGKKRNKRTRYPVVKKRKSVEKKAKNKKT